MPSGRPKKNTKLIEINDIRCEYITSKEDKYENNISYIKIVDTKKLKPILAESNETCKLPLWLTDEELYMLKVKTKFMKTDHEPHDFLNASFEFKLYSFENEENKLIQGYYVSKFQGVEIVMEQV